MTYSDYQKVFKQLESKPVKLAKYKKHNAPKEGRKCGMTQKRCEQCGRFSAHISKYGLNFCRQCFRELAPKLGFKKYN